MVWGKGQGLFFFHVSIQLFQLYLLKRHTESSLLKISWKKYIYMVLDSIPSYWFVYRYAYHTVLYTVVFYTVLKTSMCVNFVLLKHFCINFRDSCQIKTIYILYSAGIWGELTF